MFEDGILVGKGAEFAVCKMCHSLDMQDSHNPGALDIFYANR